MVEDQVRLTHAALANETLHLASGLVERGLEPGTRVAGYADSSIAGILWQLATLAGGGIWVPINARYRAEEVRSILEDASPRWLVTDTTHLPTATAASTGLGIQIIDGAHTAPWAGLQPHAPSSNHEAIAWLLYTSGTTGRSKGVALSHRALLSGLGSLTRLWCFSPEDRLVLSLPLFHVHGLGLGVIGSLLHGTSIVLHKRFDPAAVVAAFREQGATVFMGVPTLYRRLLDHLDAHPKDADALKRARLFTSGSAPLAPSVWEDFRVRTGHAILERYGMTETLLTLSNPYEGNRRPGTVGQPVPGAEIRIVNDAGLTCAPDELGEIHVRGPFLMSGYWNQPTATEEVFRDGWFCTGDMASVDAEGYVRILGRRTFDFIKSGGFRIGTREIEDRLRSHPAVREVAVVGLPDETWGQAVTAAVVTQSGFLSSPALAQELAAWVSAALADYKKPRRVVFREALPVNALGKVQKNRLLKEL